MLDKLLLTFVTDGIIIKITVENIYLIKIACKNICMVTICLVIKIFLFLLFINYLPQAVVSDSLLCADNTCIVFQHKNVTEIEKQLLRDFSSLCDWFVDNKLSVHFGQEKTKSILFGTKHKLRNAKTLNIVCNGTAIKQYEKVKYLGCILDQSLSGESMALNVIDKVNSRLKVLHRQNLFSTPPLSRLLCNALIQPFF